MLRYDMKNAREARFTIVQFQIKLILSFPEIYHSRVEPEEF